MEASLIGRLILIAEDEPLIALDMTLAFEDEGAWVIRARTLNEALLGVEDLALSVAILDHALSDGDSTQVCGRLKERNIPFVTYSGYDHLAGICRGGMHVKKPASMSVLVATVKGLLSQRELSNRRTTRGASSNELIAQTFSALHQSDAGKIVQATT
jgi:DNA-binding response OmpR family regulator